MKDQLYMREVEYGQTVVNPPYHQNGYQHRAQEGQGVHYESPLQTTEGAQELTVDWAENSVRLLTVKSIAIARKASGR